MKKQYEIDTMVPHPDAAASHPKRTAVWVFALCLLGVSLALSMALLGDALSRFVSSEAAVIDLLPPRGTEATRGADPALSKQGVPPAPPRQTAPVYINGGTSYTPAQPGGAYGELQVADKVQAWSGETKIDLFQTGYDDTVQSDNGEKVIAPGTSHLYEFKVRNNGSIPLDYAVSLEVDTYLGKDGDYPRIPLEWRLLDGAGTAVSDWENHNERTEVLRQATLQARNQDRYTVEWRWAFERGGDLDAADTEMGDIAVSQPLGVKATLYLYAEQSAGWQPGSGGEDGLWGIPQTGDTFNVILYAVLLTGSFCGLLILLAIGRKRRKEQENDRKES